MFDLNIESCVLLTEPIDVSAITVVREIREYDVVTSSLSAKQQVNNMAGRL